MHSRCRKSLRLAYSPNVLIIQSLFSTPKKITLQEKTDREIVPPALSLMSAFFRHRPNRIFKRRGPQSFCCRLIQASPQFCTLSRQLRTALMAPPIEQTECLAFPPIRIATAPSPSASVFPSPFGSGGRDTLVIPQSRSSLYRIPSCKTDFCVVMKDSDHDLK